jgi:DNA methylase
VSKAIDKAAGAERKIVGPPPYTRGKTQMRYSETRDSSFNSEVQPVTAPATDKAQQWSGWGTALKPASEHWILVRKPLAEATVAANVLKHGTGALNIDATRIQGEVPNTSGQGFKTGKYGGQIGRGEATLTGEPWSNRAGRWPANLAFTHDPRCQQVGTRQVPTGTAGPQSSGIGSANTYSPSATNMTGIGEAQSYGDEQGMETVSAWSCVEGCPVKLLDEQAGIRTSGSAPEGLHRHAMVQGVYGGGKGLWDSDGPPGQTYGDTGSVSRFFATFNGREGEALAERRYDDSPGDFSMLPGARREAAPPSRFFATFEGRDERITESTAPSVVALSRNDEPTVHGDAPESPPPSAAASPAQSSQPVDTAETRSPSSPGTTSSSVREDAPPEQDAKRDQPALSVGDRADSPATDIAPSDAATKGSHEATGAASGSTTVSTSATRKSSSGSDDIGTPATPSIDKRSSPASSPTTTSSKASPATNAGPSEPTATIPTIPDPLRSGGSAEAATSDSTSPSWVPGVADSARFMYTAKASSSERSADGLVENHHPTVKSTDLMRWLCRLVTPPGGLVLDPFLGSGSTLVAAKLEGFGGIGIERQPEYMEIARRRLGWAVHEPSLFDDL